MEPSEHAYKPPNAVNSILSGQLFEVLPQSHHFQGLSALPKKFAAATRGTKHEGRIRVNKEASSCLLTRSSQQPEPCVQHTAPTRLSTTAGGHCCWVVLLLLCAGACSAEAGVS
jgi:hypothetical protein